MDESFSINGVEPDDFSSLVEAGDGLNDIPQKKLEDDFDNQVELINNNDIKDVDVEVEVVAELEHVINVPTINTQPESMRVYVRVRPTDDVIDNTIKEITSTMLITTAPDSSNRAKYTKTEQRQYKFSQVFGPESIQNEVFNGMVSPMLDRYLNGDSCVLFAYGMTNSGKTHTIQGNKKDPGILPLLIKSVMNKLKDDNGWNLSISMLEIYQEKIHDLLNKSRSHLAIRDINGRVDVPKLSNHEISLDNAFKLMNKAAKNRTNSSTFMNKGSSRSHAIYTLTLTQIISGREVSSIFQVVDLAGSERNSRTRATSAQQKEANNINTSLMQLWRCLSGMKKRSNDNSDIIPFRESKLTHILMPLLGRAGLAGVSMLACVNPQSSDYDETLSVLSNASLACKIKEISDIENRALYRESNNNNTITSNAYLQVSSSNNILSNQIIKNKKSNTNHRTSSLISDVTMESTLSNVNNNDNDSSKYVLENEQLNETIKNLRLQLEEVEQERDALLRDKMIREAEIRTEVSNEMAIRSQHLLEQIHNLQEQLYQKSNNDIIDVTKSCRKLRRDQIHIANAENIRHIEEAEAELTRVQNQHEKIIEKLKYDNNNLLADVEKYRNLAHKYSSSNNDNKKNIIHDDDNNIESAETFSKRMKRDQRFKGSKSPMKRSPLQIVKNDENSPLKRKSNSNYNDDGNPSKRPYLTKLRSQFAKE